MPHLKNTTPRSTLLSGIAGLALLIACSPSPQSLGDIDGPAMTVWNQAYQEITQADALAEVVAQARNAYVLLDPFMEGIGPSIAPAVERLKANGNQVSAYISVGTGEVWRDDFAALRPNLVSKQWGEWEGEYLVSTPNDAVLAVMKARIDKIADWGFEWVEFDNMGWASDDEYRAKYQFAATLDDSINYYQELCAHVRVQSMRCMAKNTVEGAVDFDVATYGSYPDDRNWWNEGGARQFASQGKLVIVVHYDEKDCTGVRTDYQAIYGPSLSFICEDPRVNGYVHF